MRGNPHEPNGRTSRLQDNQMQFTQSVELLGKDPRQDKTVSGTRCFCLVFTPILANMCTEPKPEAPDVVDGAPQYESCIN